MSESNYRSQYGAWDANENSPWVSDILPKNSWSENIFRLQFTRNRFTITFQQSLLKGPDESERPWVKVDGPTMEIPKMTTKKKLKLKS